MITILARILVSISITHFLTSLIFICAYKSSKLKFLKFHFIIKVEINKIQTEITIESNIFIAFKILVFQDNVCYPLRKVLKIA